ncbi:uncharacterized protein N7518_002013 [Penicillium psychrosexuale]|uniref:uncharacterized protein n=1 Tax=Penicillium psychrosexuale TaxID=1002107 RepID=UPI002544DBC7|nr:uncharacterized protein N7518_002013 [Penicillium psychrosexuale]KAJ5799945.1 hypothetical protein N7518_002013 [Penicillium psychrosexuale]
MDRVGVDAVDMAEVRGDVAEDRETEAEEEIMQKVDERHHILLLQVSTTRNQCTADIPNLFLQHLICLPNPTIMDKRRPFNILKTHLHFHLNNIPSR